MAVVEDELDPTRKNPMKTYSQHNCERNHKSLRTFANCVFKYALWVAGRGAYACVSRCTSSAPGWRHVTVTLWPTKAQALAAKDQIDNDACGGQCSNEHEVILLSMHPAEAPCRPHGNQDHLAPSTLSAPEWRRSSATSTGDRK